MSFAENNRISHRQLRRQIQLTMAGPFLLCLVGSRGVIGIWGAAGILVNLLLLGIYTVFLIRLSYSYTDLVKTFGSFWGRLTGILFLVYAILTAAYLLHVIGEIVPESLLLGVPPWLSGLLAAFVTSLGSHMGMQKRGRMAEVSGGVILGGIFLLLLLGAFQGSAGYFAEMAAESSFSLKETGRQTYTLFAAFSGVSLLPFILEDVEKPKSAGKAVGSSIFLMGILLFAALMILPAVLGWDRLLAEPYPILPMLASANLPGDVLSRFDVIWLALLLFSLLFAVGSMFYYGNRILSAAYLFGGRFWIWILAWLLSLDGIPGWNVKESYPLFLMYGFVPLVLLSQAAAGILYKKRRKSKKEKRRGTVH